MTIATALIVIWLIGTFLYFIPKPLTLLQNVIIFMILVMITRMVITILDMQLSYMDTANKHIPHLAYLLIKELLKPFMILVLINLYLHWGNPVYKGFLVIITYIAIILINVFSLQFGLVTYVKWNFAYDLLYEGSYLLFAFMLSQLVLRLKESK